jgi:cyclic pyranopterin monophosphate synthase
MARTRRLTQMFPGRLTHLQPNGSAHMVDVALKPETERVAIASAQVRMAAPTLQALRKGTLKKGDALAAARIAGLAAVKRTSDLIPLCHPLRVTGADIKLRPLPGAGCVDIRATVRAVDRTGVEMEALTAVAVAALAIYDMAKAIDRGMTIGPIQLEEKRGGRSGVWKRTRRRSGR